MKPQLQEMKHLIESRVFSRYKDAGQDRWVFDFRAVCMTKDFMDLYASIFFQTLAPKQNIQVCGLESASIPLVSALVYAAEGSGVRVNGLFVRKGRKKHDLRKAIEGAPDRSPVILVDDILNSGKTMEQQIQVLKAAGLRVEAIFCLLRFRDESFYEFLKKDGIRVITLFELDDFRGSLAMKNEPSNQALQPLPYAFHWRFTAPPESVNYKDVVPKSAPTVYGDTVLFGTDSGLFYCLDKHDGSIIWTHEIRYGDGAKRIFSSPVVHDGTVYFGAYDGCFYALDAATGKKRWTYAEADWIGSSPCISIKNDTVYVGLEFGLWKKRGGIVALDAKTGAERWRDTHEGLTHCSPYVSERHDLLFCGSNDGILRIYDSWTGEKRAEHMINEPIRASFSENETGTRVACGAFDKRCYLIDTRTLAIADTFETNEAIYSTPLWIGDVVIVNSLDKHVYAYDTAKQKLLWKFLTRGRIFSDPVLYDGAIFTGSNDGILYKIDPATGKELGHIQFPERIVNRIAMDSATGRVYIPTFANELRCLSLAPQDEA